MAGIVPAKMKRKDLEEVYDEFSEFSLSSPARKIRRLDAELPPIVEEEEPAVPLVFEQPIPNELMSSSMPGLESVMVDDLPDVLMNEERALVLYKPVNNPLLLTSSSSNVSYRVSEGILSGLKNKVFWPGNPNPITVEEAPAGDKPAVAYNCLAVVPWQAPVTAFVGADSQSVGAPSEEPMDAELAEGASMEIEEEDKVEATDTGVGGDGLHQWPQHCMTPQLPPNPSAPIMWSWG